MQLAFANEEIANWAAFSQDYNRIHFDAEAGRQAGSTGIIVHGMLAVLPIKEMLGRTAAITGGDDDWRRFKVRFKKAIPAGKKLTVDFTEKSSSDRKVSFALRQNDDDTLCVQGQFLRVSTPELLNNGFVQHDYDVYHLSARTLKHRRDVFTAKYPDISQPWVALDAIVFAEFLSSMIGSVVERANIEVSDEAIVMQTSHAVEFNEAWATSETLGKKDLICRVRTEEPLIQAQAATGHVTIECFHGGLHVMNINIGLMMIKPS